MAQPTYQVLLHSVALRLSALVGTDKTVITASYNTAVLTAADFKSADWPFNAFKDAILMAEADFAWAIADCGGHPWRQRLAVVSSAVISGTSPVASAPGPSIIIGVIGSVKDTNDGIVLTEQPLELIRRINAESAWRIYPLYYFKMDDMRLFHTRPSVVVDLCFYDRDACSTAFDANDKMLLPDVLELAITARAISYLTRDGAFSEQAAIYRSYSDEALVRIRAGQTTLPGKALPGPSVIAT